MKDTLNHRATFRIADLAALQYLAAALARSLAPRAGLTIGLSGPLGAGKTEFVRSLLGSLGHIGSVPSPTFVLESQYEVRLKECPLAVHHWDLYRLGGDAVPEDLLDCSRDPCGLTLIEWPEQITAVLALLDIRFIVAFDDPPTVHGGGGATQLPEPARLLALFASSSGPGVAVVEQLLSEARELTV